MRAGFFMKKCIYCAEEIQDEAVKCRYCGEFLDGGVRRRVKGNWRENTGVIVFALLTIGPFALPLVWRHGKFSRGTKIAITVGMVVLTAVICFLFYYVMVKLFDAYRDFMGEMG